MATTRPDTDELAPARRRGQRDAREGLLARHRDRLRRMVAVRLDRRLAARVDPSDIVQEALADAARGLDRLPAATGRCRSTPGCASSPGSGWSQLHRHHISAQQRSVEREEAVGPALARRVGRSPWPIAWWPAAPAPAAA